MFLIYTTDSDRTHMSAQAYVAGLFPPTKDSIWKKDMKWQPIPVRTVNESILHPFPAFICPSYSTELFEVVNKTFLKIKRETENLIDIIANKTGYKEMTLIHLSWLYDNFNLQYIFKFPQQKWVEEIYPEPLRSIMTVYYGTLGFSKNLRRLGKTLIHLYC